MKLSFVTKEIPKIVIKKNGKIKASIDKYKNRQVPMKVFLTNFLAVKTKGDILEKADNPWAYLHKVIEGHEIESGVSEEETLFNFSTMNLKNELLRSFDGALY